MPRLRVSGGELRGRRLAGPRRGEETRPTTERVREAVFSALGDVSGLRVLDLFCGTGALGIEAISRGAASAALVDRKPSLAQKNVEELGLEDRAEVAGTDAFSYLRGAPAAAFDLVLCDPPYGLDSKITAELGPLLVPTLAPGGRVMLETSPDRPIEVELPLAFERRYGDTLVRMHLIGGRA
jgi:16S rRNA (guanine966-N2)-methyltransferase